MPLRDSKEINVALDVLNVPVSAIQAKEGTGTVMGGSYVVTAADGVAGTLDIDTGLSDVDTFTVQILVAGVNATADAAISEATGTLTVANGAATYTVAENDVINWVAIGTI
jgi:hypothetical protein